MDLVKWTEEYSVGISEFDEQHKRLFALINDLYAAMKTGKGKDALGEVLKGLSEYASYHFATEEKFFAKFGYPETDKHAFEHGAFIAQVKDLKTKFDKGSILVSLETLEFLKNWIQNHINKVDKQYSGFLIASGMK
jgi:hemerythrin